MFGIGSSEIILCLLVALVVLGPERLPAVARALGRWTGQARSYLRNLSAELERETQISELKQQLEDAQRVLREHAAVGDATARKLMASGEAEARKIGGEIKSVADAGTPPSGNKP